ncbi:beta-galactosidase subunit beta [Streptococcus pneumoniae]|nr:beta-galactosidase subunit beta [Streptococcus pneumoniae]
MIITKISRLGTYVGVNPHFATLIPNYSPLI